MNMTEFMDNLSKISKDHNLLVNKNGPFIVSRDQCEETDSKASVVD